MHKPELKVETDAMRRLFGVGHHVGAIARQQYPDGILIGSDDNLDRAIVETEAALYARRPVFEATFEHEDVLIRADVMVPDDESGGWHMVEVKSTASAKPYHVPDVATQLWVARAFGVRVERASVRHIDRSFVLPPSLDAPIGAAMTGKPGDYRGLFTDTDVTSDVEGLLPTLPATVADARATLEAAEPDVRPGDHCTSPQECPFQAYCGAAPRVPRRKFEPFHDAEGAARTMDEWAWPRYFLDFETIGHTVPVWVGTRPFEQAPFQFSSHVMARDGSLTHRGFLDLTGDDPTRACAQALLETLGRDGSIVTYSSFERKVIQTMARRCPDLAPQLQQLESSIVDLLPVVRGHYYHDDLQGSYSIKSVLPALVPDLSYTALDGVKDGLMAQAAYLEATSFETCDERRARIRQELTDYCSLDTIAMVSVAEALSSRHA